LVGIEADISGSGLKQTSILNTTFPTGTTNIFNGQPITVVTSIQNDWLATLRPRLGYVANHALFYVTGGLAVGDVKYSQINTWVNNTPSPIVTDVASVSRTAVGWTAGAGAAYAFTNNWSVRAEYLYTDLGNVGVATRVVIDSVIPTSITTLNHSANLTTNTVRVGLDYKFGGRIVAKY
jgi:outer membrane immunogenic protein